MKKHKIVRSSVLLFEAAMTDPLSAQLVNVLLVFVAPEALSRTALWHRKSGSIQ